MGDEGELKKRMFGIGTGSLTSFEISYNLKQCDKDPEWAKRGRKTKNYQSIKWQRKDQAYEIIDEAKKDFPELIMGNDSQNLQTIVNVAHWFIKYFGSEITLKEFGDSK